MRTVRKNIQEIATLAPRGQNGVIYPAGTSAVQISASKGQMLYLSEPGSIPNHYASIVPKRGMNGFYLFLVIEMAMPAFVARYRQGLNLIASDLKFLEVDIHPHERTRNIVCDFLKLQFGGGQTGETPEVVKNA